MNRQTRFAGETFKNCTTEHLQLRIAENTVSMLTWAKDDEAKCRTLRQNIELWALALESRQEIIVERRHVLAPCTLDLIWRGSGDPDDTHELIGARVITENGNLTIGVFTDIDDIEEAGNIK